MLFSTIKSRNQIKETLKSDLDFHFEASLIISQMIMKISRKRGSFLNY